MKTSQTNNRYSYEEIIRKKKLFNRLDELKKVIPQINKQSL